MSNTAMEIEECINSFLEAVHDTEFNIESETLNISDCYGRVLAEDILAPVNVPSFNRSAMDGYAVNADDVIGASREKPAALRVAGEILAGDYKEIPYEKGSAVRVMTGAYIPDGYNAVIMQENTDYGEAVVEIYSDIEKYRNYCRAGEDIEQGSIVLKKGSLLGSAHIGVLASLGLAYVKVKKGLRAAIISTGTEIITPGDKLIPGKIYNNTAFILESAIKRAGLRISLRTSVPDDENILADAIKNGAACADIVITTGAVSVGKRDIIPAVLENIGADILFRGANIQPGTPTIGSVFKGKPIISLSGNPYAALANFELYFWSLAAKIMSCPQLEPCIGEGIMQEAYEKKNKRRRLIRAYIKDGRVTLPESTHSSSVISNMINCNCFIDLPAGKSLMPKDVVKVRYLRY